MIAKYLQSPGLPFQRNNCYAVFDPVSRNPVTDHPKRHLPSSDYPTLSFGRLRPMLLHQTGQYRVRLIIYKYAPRLDLPQKDAKLLQVYLKGGKDIDMIPGNSGKNRN